MQRKRALQDRIDGVRLRTPAGINSENLAGPLARQRRSDDEAVDVFPLQTAIGQRATKRPRSVTVAILISRTAAGTRIIFRVIGVANTDNGDVIAKTP